MGLGTVMPPRAVHVTAVTSATWQYVAMTDWQPGDGADSASIVVRQSGTTTLIGRPAIRTADRRTDKPGTWTTLGTTDLTDDGELVLAMRNIATTTDNKAFYQLGYAFKASTGSFGQGDVWMQANVDAWGMKVGASRFQVSTDTADKQVMAVTGWIPAIYADKVKFAIATTELATLNVLPVFQTATTLPSTAGAWMTATTDWTPAATTITSDGETCTGELVPAGLANVMWVRFGVAFWLNGGTRGQADVEVSVSVRTA